jgi:hypothetical protein
LGEHHPAIAEPDADANAEPYTNGISVGQSSFTGSVAGFHIRISAGDANTFASAVTRPMGPRISRSGGLQPADLIERFGNRRSSMTSP